MQETKDGEEGETVLMVGQSQTHDDSGLELGWSLMEENKFVAMEFA